MHTQMREAVERTYAAVDRGDADELVGLLTDDVEMTDEVTRTWLRGREAVAAYVEKALAETPGLVSELTDVATRAFGDTGVVSFVVTQRYPVDGKTVTVAGPGTVVLRRTDGDWRIALIQSTPFPVE